METQETITAWAQATFGEPPTPCALVARLNEEMAELVSVAAQVFYSVDDMVSECADVYIVLCQITAWYGRSLQAAVDQKMRVNRARKWKVTSEGLGQHE